MKPKLFSTAFMLIFCLTLHAQAANSLAELGLRGKVKSYSETEFQMIERYGTQGESRRSQCSFNQDGCKTEERQSDASGSLMLRTVYEYNEQGRAMQDRIYGSSNELLTRQVYSYEQNKMLVKTQGVLVRACSYSSDKLLIKEEFYEEAGGLAKTCVFQYNVAGQKIEEKQRSPQGKVQATNRFSYNDKGLLASSQELNEKGALIYQSSYQYNDKGDLIMETASYVGDPEPITLLYAYKYDTQDNWIEMSETMNGKMYAITIRRVNYY